MPRLKRYRAKRSADRTPEPFGGEPTTGGASAARRRGAAASPAWARPRLFCVQKHAARRLHYDLRLEWGGVLRSWAVPKGPTLDPGEKRLAVEVEDHPVEYADFEGVIPEGNYGAGEAIVWDRGVWVPLEDPDETLPRGKLSFELRGYKLRGAWHLFRTKGKGKTASKEWMLVKRADAWASPRPRLPEQSVDSGLTVEEIRTGSTRAAELGAELQRLRRPVASVRAEAVKLMLAEVAERPFSDPAWLFELKYDGFRVLGSREAGEPRLRYRRGADATASYPEIARALRLLPFGDLVLDGEIVVLDEEGRPSFQRLQQRAQQRRKPDIERGALELPVTYCVFDLLGFEGYDLRPLPLVERKRLLQLVLPRAGPLRFVEHIAAEGEALLRGGGPPGARGRDGEARRLALRLRPLERVAQAAPAPRRGLRRRRPQRAAGRKDGLRRAAPGRLRRRRPRLLRARGQRLRREAAAGSSGAARARPARGRRPAPGPSRAGAARCGSSRASWSRCAITAGPRRVCCDSRSSSGCATTSSRRSA